VEKTNTLEQPTAVQDDVLVKLVSSEALQAFVASFPIEGGKQRRQKSAQLLSLHPSEYVSLNHHMLYEKITSESALPFFQAF
jgi:hypothetical protein